MYASIGNSGKKKLVSLRYDLIGTFLYSQTKSRDALQSGYFFMGKPIYEVHRELVGVLTASYKLCHKTITPEALTLVGKKFHHGLKLPVSTEKNPSFWDWKLVKTIEKRSHNGNEQ